MRLYYYDTYQHLTGPLTSGALLPSESNLKPTDDPPNPQVVWLSTEQDPSTGGWVLPIGEGERPEVRVTVNVPDEWVRVWDDWAYDEGIDPDWKKDVIKMGGGPSSVARWRVVLRPVPIKMWESIEDVSSGHPYDIRHARYRALMGQRGL